MTGDNKTVESTSTPEQNDGDKTIVAGTAKDITEDEVVTEHNDVEQAEEAIVEKEIAEQQGRERELNGDNADTEISGIEKGVEQTTEAPELSTPEKAETVTSAATKKPKARLPILLIALVIILLGLLVGGYFVWQFWTDYDAKQQQRISALENSLAQQLRQVNELRQTQSSQSTDQTTALSDLQQEQAALQERLDSHTQRLRALAGNSRDDWLLAEARYLLRLAAQRLLVENATDGARGLLEAADKILLSVDDSGVLPVRKAIANEIIALKLAKTVDREGVYLKIAALKSQIQLLPLVPFRKKDESAVLRSTDNVSDNDQNNEEASAPWYASVWNSVKSAGKSLSDHVKIRDHEQAPDLLISEQQQLQVLNNLMLMFDQAQFALLHEEDAIYKESLEQAINWWSIYYSHYSEYEIVNSEIKRLQSIDIIQQIPGINRSAELLTDYIEQFHHLNAAEPVKKKAKPVEEPQQ